MGLEGATQARPTNPLDWKDIDDIAFAVASLGLIGGRVQEECLGESFLLLE